MFPYPACDQCVILPYPVHFSTDPTCDLCEHTSMPRSLVYRPNLWPVWTHFHTKVTSLQTKPVTSVYTLPYQGHFFTDQTCDQCVYTSTPRSLLYRPNLWHVMTKVTHFPTYPGSSYPPFTKPAEVVHDLKGLKEATPPAVFSFTSDLDYLQLTPARVESSQHISLPGMETQSSPEDQKEQEERLLHHSNSNCAPYLTLYFLDSF